MNSLLRIVAFAVTAMLMYGCSVTRHIPDGEYYLQKVTVEDDREVPKRERLTAADFSHYIRQTPNPKLLGTNFYVWVYNSANPEKQNRWNNFKRRLGKAPVIFDEALTERSADNIKAYMNMRGYYSSEATFEVDTTRRPKRAYVTYRTRQGRPYRIGSVRYDFRDKFLAQIIEPDTAASLVRKGEILDIDVLDAERKRISDYLRERGYYTFTVNNIEYLVDTLGGDYTADVTLVVKQAVTGYDDRGEAIMSNNTVYRISEINLFPNYDPTVAVNDPAYIDKLDTVYYRGLNIIYPTRLNIRRQVLRTMIPLYPNHIYNTEEVSRTYQDIMSMGYYKSARIAFAEQPQPDDEGDDDYVTYIGKGMNADSTSMLRAREGYLQCNILCTPALKQSFKLELEGSTTSSFYGVSATVGYQHRNIFRGAEALDISGTIGYEYMKTPDAPKRNATEVGFTAGLSFPRLLLPIPAARFNSVNQPRTRLQLSLLFQNRPYYRRILAGGMWTYSWSNNRYSSFSVSPANINVIDMKSIDEAFMQSITNPYLLESFRSQLVAGISGTYTYNNQRRNLGGDATLIQFNWETAGNLIHGLEHLFSEPRSEGYYTLFGLRYAQYFRVDLSLSHKIMLGEKTAVAGRLYGGVGMAYGNGTSVPYDRLFYAGGSNSMRGWTPRTLGPGGSLAPEYLPGYSDDQYRYPQQMGDIKLEANLEFRFPIWGIFHGATFLDLGNVWYMKENGSDPAGVFHGSTFYKQLGFNTGLGIRLDIKFAVLRLDWGIQLHNPNRPAGERWINNFKWHNTALNFGVGYPF